VAHRTIAELEAALEEFRRAPADRGHVDLVVRRPSPGEREVLTEATLDLTQGLVGDGWLSRGSRHTPDGTAHPDQQLTVINVRLARFVAVDPERQPLAGDQLHVDLDLSTGNLPPGTHLALGSAVIEVTAKPHTGCAKFVERFGRDAMRFVNSPQGRELRLRGLNAKVVVAGIVRPGDTVRKLPAPAETPTPR
jgi:MOSC domain-containing protein YiiM